MVARPINSWVNSVYNPAFAHEKYIVIDKSLLSILVCPISKAPLKYVAEDNELVCAVSGLAYPIKDDIPVMLESEARELTLEEKEKYKA